MTEFTPLSSLFGGALIGLAATLLMVGPGRILGASGILAGLVFPSSRGEMVWKGLVVVGLIAAFWLMSLAFGITPNVVPPVPLWLVAIGGLIVGVGVTIGGGCTSGHGICGLARFSVRSVVAVLTFMSVAFVTVYVVRHVIGGA